MNRPRSAIGTTGSALMGASLQARGDGVVTHDGFSAKVSYTRSCPGEARLSAVKNERDGALTGDISTSDCDGSNSGTFRFSPRD